jgi:hypothetical protein
LHLLLDRSAAGADFDEVVLSGPAAPGVAEAITRAMASSA